MLEEVVVDWQENVADKAKLRCLIHSAFEALVVWCVVGPFLLTNASGRHCSFRVSYQFAEHPSQM